MPRIPRGLHLSGSSGRNHGGRPYRPPRVPQEAFTVAVRAPIHDGTGQAIVSGAGSAMIAVGPAGVGCRWYPSQIQIATSSGPTDGSQVNLYRLFIDPKQAIGLSLQGGGDTIGFTIEMQPGELVYAVWSNANPGDLATLAITGDQMVLASA